MCVMKMRKCYGILSVCSGLYTCSAFVGLEIGVLLTITCICFLMCLKGYIEFPFYRGVSLWDSLPKELQKEQSRKTFKNIIKISISLVDIDIDIT